MDLEGYTAWEAHVVRGLAGAAPVSARSPEASLHLLDRHARMLARWKPGSHSLSEAVRSLDIDARDQGFEPQPDWDAERQLFDLARKSLPLSHAWAGYPRDAARLWTPIAAAWSEHATVINRFLAAHSFASWMAYQGNGLLPLTRRLHLALAVLRAEVMRVCAEEGSVLTTAQLKQAIRQTDLLLVHFDRPRHPLQTAVERYGLKLAV